MNSLDICSLAVKTTIGVYAFEQRIKQTLLIDIHIPLPDIDHQDKLEHALDYAVLCEKVTQMVEGRSFQLIETVASQVAELIQAEFKVTTLKIAIQKPHAVRNAKNITYTLNIMVP